MPRTKAPPRRPLQVGARVTFRPDSLPYLHGSGAETVKTTDQTLGQFLMEQAERLGVVPVTHIRQYLKATGDGKEARERMSEVTQVILADAPSGRGPGTKLAVEERHLIVEDES